RWIAVPALAAVAGVALLAGVRLGQPGSTPDATATATPRVQAVLQDVGDGRVLTVDGRADGPTPVPVSIDGTAVVGQRFQGYGTAVVGFDPPDGSFEGGRVLVDVTSSAPTRVSWRALIMLTRMDWTSYPLVAARGIAQDHSGARAPTVFVYPSRPPTRIAVEAPPGVGWTLVVAISGQLAPDLH
uniref:hypothetical protein n=1 Tax=uncultured Amnibacterium sp. TaxID=1631851 RepID=UPI0035C954D6